MQAMLMVAAGLLTGIMSGLFGIGGGVILIPILVLLLQFKQHTASGISLVALMLPVGILGVMQYIKSGQITYHHFKYGLIIAAGIFIGTYFGARFAGNIPDAWLRKSFSLVLLVVAVRMWLQHDAV